MIISVWRNGGAAGKVGAGLHVFTVGSSLHPDSGRKMTYFIQVT